MPQWTEADDIPRIRTKFDEVLAEVEAEQPNYPDMWAELRRYANPNTAYDRMQKLKSRFPRFEFKTATDPETREGVLYGRHLGDNDPDVRDSKD